MFRCPLRSLTLSNDLPWPPKWRSFQNTSSYTCGVFVPRFFGVENPNLRSDWCLDVHWGHWSRPMTSLDDLPWPPKLRSFQNRYALLHMWVSFPRFFGVENPNLRSDWCLDVNWGHWRCPMTSLDLQNGGHFRIRPLTHVGCLFLGFLGWRIRFWGQIDV